MTIKILIADVVGKEGSSLLMNNPASMENGDDVGIKASKKKYEPEEEARIRVYKDEKDHMYIPAVAFRASLMNAAKGRKVGKKFATALVKGAVFNAETRCYLTNPETGKPLKANGKSKNSDYGLHSTRVRVGNAGVMRVRPEIERWATKVAFEVDDDFIREEQVIELLNIAGRMAGVLDWRPEKSGAHGRFEVLNKEA